jgi:hypothetical protein
LETIFLINNQNDRAGKNPFEYTTTYLPTKKIFKVNN